MELAPSAADLSHLPHMRVLSAIVPQSRRVAEHPFLLRPASLLVIVVMAFSGMFAVTASAQDAAAEDEDFEALYFKASDLMVENKFEEAKAMLEKAFASVGDFGWEDYGKGFGGVYFDYGTCLLRLNMFEDARDAFKACSESDVLAKDSKIGSTNKRKNIALFEWGFCEDKLGDPKKALELYQQYIDAKPDETELMLVRSALALRMGSAHLHSGNLEAGTAKIQEIFENKAEWRVGAEFLMQGLLELGLGWIDQAVANPGQATEIAKSAHLFLDEHEASLQLSPFDKQRFGMIERLRKLGYDSNNSGMSTLALRYYSMIPTTKQVLDDLKMRSATYGDNIPAVYAELISKEEAKLASADPPQVELLRLTASAWDRLGNRHAARAIYAHLAQNFPESKSRAEILHEAARFSTFVADYSSAQFYGDLFMAEMPEDHKLRNNVATFMLQSLFTARKYDLVLEIATKVRDRYDIGSDERDLPDFLFASSLYYSGKHEEAQPELDAFVKNYQESGNLEAAQYYQASNSVVLGQFEKAASLLDAFLTKFPETKFLDLALLDRATCHFNAEQYALCAEKGARLIEEKPESAVLDRAYNLVADAKDALSYDAEEEDEAKLLEESLKFYRGGIAAAQKKENLATGSEATAKATDVALRLEKWEDAVALYDSFFPIYEGSSWEAQISVFSLEALEKVGRVEDGLKQLEKMIVMMGSQEEGQDIELLRKAIGSYSEASVEHRGAEETISAYDNFPGLDPNNQALLTWLQIQKVIVLQGLRQAHGKDTPEYAAVDKRIDAVFEKLRGFDIANLSDFALQQVGLYLKEDQPFLAKRYFEELLNRNAPDFKVPADFSLGEIEARGTDDTQLKAARERFLRVVNTYKDPEYSPESHLYLGRIGLKLEDWQEAIDNFRIINKKKGWLDREQRAESNVGYGIAAEELGDIQNAKNSYLNVLAVYLNIGQWSGIALERGFNLTLEETKAAGDREKQIQAYAFLKRMLYIMQKIPDDDSPALARMRLRVAEVRTELGITVEEDAALDAKLGINQPE